MNPWITQQQVESRKALDGLLKLSQKVYMEIPEVKEKTIPGLRQELREAFDKLPRGEKKFKVLLAMLGLEVLDSGYLLLHNPNPDEVYIDLEVYEQWQEQDQEYRRRMR